MRLPKRPNRPADAVIYKVETEITHIIHEEKDCPRAKGRGKGTSVKRLSYKNRRDTAFCGCTSIPVIDLCYEHGAYQEAGEIARSVIQAEARVAEELNLNKYHKHLIAIKWLENVYTQEMEKLETWKRTLVNNHYEKANAYGIKIASKNKAQLITTAALNVLPIDYERLSRKLRPYVKISYLPGDGSKQGWAHTPEMKAVIRFARSGIGLAGGRGFEYFSQLMDGKGLVERKNLKIVYAIVKNRLEKDLAAAQKTHTDKYIAVDKKAWQPLYELDYIHPALEIAWTYSRRKLPELLNHNEIIQVPEIIWLDIKKDSSAKYITPLECQGLTDQEIKLGERIKEAISDITWEEAIQIGQKIAGNKNENG